VLFLYALEEGDQFRLHLGGEQVLEPRAPLHVVDAVGNVEVASIQSEQKWVYKEMSNA
jgi:hypothetical protein